MLYPFAKTESLPPRERELKLASVRLLWAVVWSLPPRERELKRGPWDNESVPSVSLPPRERELKQLGHGHAELIPSRSPRGSVN